MKNTLTFIEIKKIYQDIVAELIRLQARESWAIHPQSIRLTKHKTKYGMACHDGTVFVNQAFLSTSARQLLDATIRHELAHLCVGLDQGHNRVFKRKAKQFKSVFGNHLSSDIKEINQRIGYKYLILAHLENGETIEFKKAHRKSAKYLDYRPKFFRYLSIKGIKVIEFEYLEKGT